jgi:NTE family protein
LSDGPGTIKQRPVVGLVLSGGAARGLAHVGVLSALEENRIPIDLIVGASFGSIVAAYYACGYSIEQMLSAARKFRLWSIRDFHRPWTSLFSGDEEERIFERSLGAIKIEDLPIPVIIVAADLEREQPFLFEKGKLSTAMRASSAFPGLFDPLTFGGHLLADGGIIGRQAVRVARMRGAEVVIFSDVSLLSRIAKRRVPSAVLKWLASRASRSEVRKKNSSLRSTLRSVLRIIRKYEEDVEPGNVSADFFIEPVAGEIKLLCFGKVEECFRLGREAGLRVVGPIAKRMFGRVSGVG